MDTSINGEPLGEWEPEDTAPRDGTVVLVKRAGAVRACTGYINENGDWSFHEDWPRHVGRVTHWQRLPHLVEIPVDRNELVRCMAVPIMHAIGGNEPRAREIASEALGRLELSCNIVRKPLP